MNESMEIERSRKIFEQIIKTMEDVAEAQIRERRE